jgi:Pyrimidine dimer DNA glycosylase
MQTFLPLADLKASVEVLDWRRLGKQRVEAMQIINALLGRSKGWVSHPATLMWARNVSGLMAYHDFCIDEWVRRGYRNTMQKYDRRAYTLPAWFGDERFHASHRAALLHKDPEFYSRYDWREEPALNYLWPEFT